MTHDGPTAGGAASTGRPARRWQGTAAVVLAVAALGAGLFWFTQRDDDDTLSSAGPTTLVTDPSSTIPTATAPPPTTLAPVTATPTTTPPTTLAPTTIAPTTTPPTTPAPTTLAPTTLPATTVPATLPAPAVPAGTPIGTQWTNDGVPPVAGIDPVFGTYLVEDGYIVELVLGPDGFSIWLEFVLDHSSDLPTVQLVDAVAVELTERTDVLLGLTPCVVGDRPSNRIVGTFLFEDAPELTTPIEVWEIEPTVGRLIPVGVDVTCENEGFGI